MPPSSPPTTPVLLASFDGLPPATPVPLETVHALFSAVAPVHKIALFDGKKHGLQQALVQFADVAGALKAWTLCDGARVPPALLPLAAAPTLRLAASQHVDLTIKVQGPRSRDFVNDVPVAAVEPPSPPAHTRAAATTITGLDYEAAHDAAVAAARAAMGGF